MNRVLYQLSYAAMGGQNSDYRRNQLCYYIQEPMFCQVKIQLFLGIIDPEVIILKILKHTILFYIGGMAYMFLEFAWRGRSHGTMFLLGGVCFLVLGQLSRRLPVKNVIVKGIAGAAAVTALELVTGLTVNRDYGIWDYRQMPFHFQGQICLPYSLLWIPVCLGAMAVYPLTERLFPSEQHISQKTSRKI